MQTACSSPSKAMELVSWTVYLFVAFLFVYLVWLLFFRPYNLFKDYTHYGYDQLQSRNHRKKDLVNLMLKRRKNGNLPPPFPNSWYAVLESDQLSVGQVKEIYVLSQNLVAWRGEDENKAVFVADAYCPHLGAHLGVGGKVTGNCIECPFHKWSFDGINGKVAHVPYAKKQVSHEKLPGLNLWHVRETNGFIWIWYHKQGIYPLWHPEGIYEVNSGQWKYRGRSEFQVTCHIQEIPENGADVAHLEALHETPGMFPKDFHKLTSLLAKIAKHKWSASWKVNECPGKRHESVINMTHSIALFGGKIDFFHINIEVRQIGAGMVALHFRTPFGEGVLIQSVTPIEPLLQRITHRFYSEPRFIHPLALIVLHGEAVQIGRDVEIWNRKCFLSKPNLLKEDSQIKSFRRWFSQFYSLDDQENKENYGQ